MGHWAAANELLAAGQVVLAPFHPVPPTRPPELKEQLDKSFEGLQNSLFGSQCVRSPRSPPLCPGQALLGMQAQFWAKGTSQV